MNTKNARTARIGFAGWSGSGKTTLIVRLIPELKQIARNCGRPEFRIAVIKHDAHRICLQSVGEGLLYADTEGKDSWKFRRAGADRVILCGPEGMFVSTEDKKKTHLMKKRSDAGPASLSAAMKLTQGMDLILIEGYKNSVSPQIGIVRRETGKGLPSLPGSFLAVVTDDAEIEEMAGKSSVFGFHQVRDLAGFLWGRCIKSTE